MQDPTLPNIAEDPAVQLTRMEGKLDRVVDRVSDLRGRVDKHEGEIATLKSQTQSLAEGASASKETAVALALALKDAKETQEATVRAEAAKSDQTWSPIARAATLLGAIAIAWSLLQAFTGAG